MKLNHKLRFALAAVVAHQAGAHKDVPFVGCIDCVLEAHIRNGMPEKAAEFLKAKRRELLAHQKRR